MLRTWMTPWNILSFLGVILALTSLALDGWNIMTVALMTLSSLGLLLAGGGPADGTATDELHIGDLLENTEPTESNKLDNRRDDGPSLSRI